MLESIKDNFTESIQIQIASAEVLPESIAQAAKIMISTLLNGNKILCCGNGGSSTNAQQFVSCLLNRFETERPSLPAIALTADNTILTAVANDYHYHEIFSKQVRALGQTNDTLLAISTSGNSKNIIKAIEAAVTKDIRIIGLTGKDGGEMAGLLGEYDVEIRIPSYRTIRIHEVHMVTLHCLCNLIDQVLFLANKN
ncbi:dnaA initiator-associating protein [Candidatus Photodesmus katoptron]|uniref:Phosphoheptose isomerase n=1 Tax=Candidatus Photodesmus katoptron Akat1 TaxID=1236703 RepID=S3EHW8_9GAMM|nr:phosphoheptose isomerase [Candidatus Photodesmus katoptron]EPE37768.1 phosphoheptose isomerase [Candidatus Photodesmus katoptron Akat1]KEY90511.1 dnaA initiator-associating protein [Candidatus Photodesmus katoptron]